MQIELKNIKRFAAGSEETECFTATIYIDGVKAGEAKNDGKGGCTMVHPPALWQKLEAHAKTLPKHKLDMGGGRTVDVDESTDTIIGTLLNNHIIERDIKRKMKNKVLFTVNGKRGIYESRTIPNLPSHLAKGEQYIRECFKKSDVARVLNFMPLAEAVALYRDEPMEA